MPINSDSTAAIAAEEEAELWTELAEWLPPAWADTAPTEASVVRFFDPGSDIARIAASWGHRLPGPDLSSLAAFGAGLAIAEAEGWADDQPHLATRAYADRRFLLGDRLLHWAVPWLDAVGRCYPEYRDPAHARRDLLLALGDRLRPAPDLAGAEGLSPPGEDSYGPLSRDVHVTAWIRSVWSGTVILDATLRSLGVAVSEAAPSDEPSGLERVPSGRGGPSRRLGTEGVYELDEHAAGKAVYEDLVSLYEIAAHRWAGLASAHPGSARLWRDLAARAAATAASIASR